VPAAERGGRLKDWRRDVSTAEPPRSGSCQPPGTTQTRPSTTTATVTHQ